MLLRIKNFNDIDKRKLMAIYSEGNKENADYFYPQTEDRTEAVEKVETDFCNYIKNEFFSGQNVYYVLECENEWVSALRLYRIEDNFYYIEALETAPKFRRKGYATQLLNGVIKDLQAEGSFKLCDCVSKKNTASLNTHKKCGFIIASENGYDYLQKEFDERCYGLEYTFKGN